MPLHSGYPTKTPNYHPHDEIHGTGMVFESEGLPQVILLARYL